MVPVFYMERPPEISIHVDKGRRERPIGRHHAMQTVKKMTHLIDPCVRLDGLNLNDDPSV